MREEIACFRHLFIAALPSLSAYFRGLSLSPTLVLLPLVASLFLCALPVHVAVRIWDVVLLPCCQETEQQPLQETDRFTLRLYQVSRCVSLLRAEGSQPVSHPLMPLSLCLSHSHFSSHLMCLCLSLSLSVSPAVSLSLSLSGYYASPAGRCLCLPVVLLTIHIVPSGTPSFLSFLSSFPRYYPIIPTSEMNCKNNSCCLLPSLPSLGRFRDPQISRGCPSQQQSRGLHGPPLHPASPCSFRF